MDLEKIKKLNESFDNIIKTTKNESEEVEGPTDIDKTIACLNEVVSNLNRAREEENDEDTAHAIQEKIETISKAIEALEWLYL